MKNWILFLALVISGVSFAQDFSVGTTMNKKFAVVKQKGKCAIVNNDTKEVVLKYSKNPIFTIPHKNLFCQLDLKSKKFNLINANGDELVIGNVKRESISFEIYSREEGGNLDNEDFGFFFQNLDYEYSDQFSISFLKNRYVVYNNASDYLTSYNPLISVVDGYDSLNSEGDVVYPPTRKDEYRSGIYDLKEQKWVLQPNNYLVKIDADLLAVFKTTNGKVDYYKINDGNIDLIYKNQLVLFYDQIKNLFDVDSVTQRFNDDYVVWKNGLSGMVSVPNFLGSNQHWKDAPYRINFGVTIPIENEFVIDNPLLTFNDGIWKMYEKKNGNYLQNTSLKYIGTFKNQLIRFNEHLRILKFDDTIVDFAEERKIVSEGPKGVFQENLFTKKGDVQVVKWGWSQFVGPVPYYTVYGEDSLDENLNLVYPIYPGDYSTVIYNTKNKSAITAVIDKVHHFPNGKLVVQYANLDYKFDSIASTFEGFLMEDNPYSYVIYNNDLNSLAITDDFDSLFIGANKFRLFDDEKISSVSEVILDANANPEFLKATNGLELNPYRAFEFHQKNGKTEIYEFGTIEPYSKRKILESDFFTVYIENIDDVDVFYQDSSGQKSLLFVNNDNERSVVPFPDNTLFLDYSIADASKLKVKLDIQTNDSKIELEYENRKQTKKETKPSKNEQVVKRQKIQFNSDGFTISPLSHLGVEYYTEDEVFVQYSVAKNNARLFLDNKFKLDGYSQIVRLTKNVNIAKKGFYDLMDSFEDDAFLDFNPVLLDDSGNELKSYPKMGYGKEFSRNKFGVFYFNNEKLVFIDNLGNLLTSNEFDTFRIDGNQLIGQNGPLTYALDGPPVSSNPKKEKVLMTIETK